MALNFMGAVFVRVTDLEQSLRFYSDILGLQLRNIEECGRIANYIINESSPLITLIKTEGYQAQDYPTFNLNYNNVLELHEKLIAQGVKVGPVKNWSSDRNVHIDFDVYDPDGNAINLIEWSAR
ncbi:glyoxalase/bleomycin resistance protein/dioxygenase superfamily protein [Paenibacillus cellulosilyticus]|uniref:Glyoxalase/bleomycin resistance protein/dioxygenase superfamily protein n=2 Tax=Paenibacillus cellulosilyticus TaxID=375489 RepID=A0A2V2YLE5_9BACL|nr:glyoxalase/bleomycin resistance protein/dioxygenase superfamily protein [Paenibacillus cellulosilyticus]